MMSMNLDDSRAQILKACAEEDLLKNDWISDLPDDILIGIVSLLTLKEAGGTSVLSKRWRDVWAYVPSLNFYACRKYWKSLGTSNASLSELIEQRREEGNKYFNGVDKVVTSHKADIIDEFRVKVDLSPKAHKEKIDNWVRFAILKKVKRLELDFYSEGINYRPYNLPELSTGVQLVSLELKYVNVTGEALEKLLHDCPTLEILLVELAERLGKLKVSGPDLKLKSLKLDKCRIEHLEISAPNLISFDYCGVHLESFPLISTPKLTQLSIRGGYGTSIQEDFMVLSSIFSQIEVFSLASLTTAGCYSKEFPVGSRIKTLYISIHVRLEYALFNFCSLIQNCPLLHRFVFKCEVLHNKFYRYFDEYDETREAFPHQHLKIVELHNFCGFEEESRFAEHLFEIAVPLEKMIIDTNSESEEGYSSTEEATQARMRALEEANRLHDVLAVRKPWVHIEIH